MAKKTPKIEDDGGLELPPPPEMPRSEPRKAALKPADIKTAPPEECEECGSRFFEGVFYDSRTNRGHRFLCVHCHGLVGNTDGTIKYTYSPEKKKWYAEKL